MAIIKTKDIYNIKNAYQIVHNKLLELYIDI